MSSTKYLKLLNLIEVLNPREVLYEPTGHMWEILIKKARKVK
jgi:hypothetical protein